MVLMVGSVCSAFSTATWCSKLLVARAVRQATTSRAVLMLHDASHLQDIAAKQCCCSWKLRLQPKQPCQSTYGSTCASPVPMSTGMIQRTVQLVQHGAPVRHDSTSYCQLQRKAQCIDAVERHRLRPDIVTRARQQAPCIAHCNPNTDIQS
jgi:hypothetical protein